MNYEIKNHTVLQLASNSPIDLKHHTHITTLLTWYDHITISDDNPKPDDRAIRLYGVIVGWYRPVMTRDGEIRQKFSGEFLRLSYGDIEKYAKLSKSQGQRAFKPLLRLGLIERYETKTARGTEMYIGLNYDRLVEISRPKVPTGWMQAALGGAPEYVLKEILHFPRPVVEELAAEYINLSCGTHFNSLRVWLEDLQIRQLEAVLIFAQKILTQPEAFESANNLPGLIKAATDKPTEVILHDERLEIIKELDTIHERMYGSRF